MTTYSPVLTVLLGIFAIIGARAVLALLGMVFMHGAKYADAKRRRVLANTCEVSAWCGCGATL